MKRERNRSKFFVVIFGSKDAKTPPSVDGEVHEFNFRKELNAWLNANGVHTHDDIAAARNSFLQMQEPDNRAVMIINGNRRVIKSTISMV